MIQLAFIELVDAAGKELKLPAGDIARVVEKPVGASITLRTGETIETQTTASAIFTAIDALWTEYLTALGDPT